MPNHVFSTTDDGTTFVRVMLDAEFKVGSILSPNGTGANAVTGVGFQPDLVLGIGHGAAADGNVANGRFLFAAGKSSSERAVASIYADDNAGDTNTAHVLKDDYFISVPTPDAALDTIDLVSMDSDGFTVTHPINRNGQIYPYLAMQGVQSKIGSFDLNTSTGNQSVTGVGFQPKLVILWTSAPNTTEGGSAHAYFSFGAGTSSSSRFSHGMSDIDNTPVGRTNRYSSDSHIYTETIEGDLIGAQADLVSLDSNGFTIEVETAPAAARRILYLAIGGGRVEVNVGRITSKTSTGNQGYTGVGFEPGALLFIADDLSVAQMDTVIPGGMVAIGFARTAAEQAYCGYVSEDAASSSDTGSRMSRTKCIGTIASTDINTQVTEADLVSMNADGFTLNWSTANATARAIHYIALAAT